MSGSMITFGPFPNAGGGIKPRPNPSVQTTVTLTPAPQTDPPTVPPKHYTDRESTDISKVVTTKLAADDGQGGLGGLPGATVDYTAGTVRFKPTEDFRYQKYETSRSVAGGESINSGTWTETTDSDTWGDGSLIRIRYRPASVTPADRVETMDAQNILINLTPYTGDTVVPNSVQFRIGTTVYIDRDGIIYRNIQPNGSGTYSGTINYNTGLVALTDWDAGGASFELQSLLTYRGQWTESEFMFYTDQAPILSGSLYVSAVAVDTGELLTAQANADGEIVGTYAAGTIDAETGLAHVRFGSLVADASLTEDEKLAPWYNPANVDGAGNIWRPRAVIPPTARYGCVVLTFVPLDPEILGLDTVRLPPNGRVPQFRPGDFIMVMHGDTVTGTPVLNAETGLYELDLGRARLAWVRITDAAGNRIDTGYAFDRAAGILRWESIDTLAVPLTVRHTIADLVIARETQITGRLALNLPLTHDYPADTTLVGSCLPIGDRRARVSAYWDQQTWSQSWEDHLVGNEALGNLNLVAHPIAITNLGAITERWVVRWTTTSTVEVFGQQVGLVYSGPFTADIAPLNPHARDEHGNPVPYWRLPVAANQGGWSAGNVFRFNTVAAQFGFWVAAALQQSPVPLGDAIDGCEIRVVGNVNNPAGE